MPAIPLQQYVKLVEFLGATLGPDYEVVLYDLQDADATILAIANGHVSGRTVGAPLTGMALQMLHNKTYMSLDYKANYSGISVNQKMLRSSTFFIKNDSGQPLGLLCVNFDDSRYQELSDQLLKLRHPDAFVDSNFVYNEEKLRKAVARASDSEVFHSSISGVTQDVVDAVMAESPVPVERLTAEEKKELVLRLKEHGVFRLKGAVKEVAALLGCSQATVYRYLGNAVGGEGKQ